MPPTLRKVRRSFASAGLSAVGDKVLQTRNNYDKDVFNGDVGRIRGIDMESQELTVDYDGRPVVYDFDELDELSWPTR